MRTRCRVTLSITLFCLSLALATPRAGAEINRFIGQDTILAGRGDLTKIDPAAVETFLLDLARAAGVVGDEPPQAPEAEVKASLARATKWINDAKQAGVSEFYLIATSANIQHPPAVIIPVADDKAAGVAALLPVPQPPPNIPAAQRAHLPQVQTLPGVGVVLGVPAAINALKNVKPAPRPELAAALTAAGEAPIKIAFAMDANMRQQVANNLPPQIFGKPATLITKDLQWALLSATPPPQVQLKAVAQSTDAASAKATQELILAALEQAKSGAPAIPEVKQLLAPQVQGDQVVLTLDKQQLVAMASAVKEPLARARLTALRIKSASNIRQILQAALMHAQDNQGKWPGAMEELEKALVRYGGAASRQVLTNPLRPDLQPGYVYLPPAQREPNPQTVVLYEAHKEFGDGINVGFADGHVEWVAQKQRFDEMLARRAQEE